MAVVRSRCRRPDLLTQRHLASAAPFPLAGFPEEHPCPRCAPGPNRWLLIGPALEMCERRHPAAVARGIVLAVRRTRGKALSHDRLDVCDPAGAVSGGERPRLLSCASLPDAACRGSRLGRTAGRQAPGREGPPRARNRLGNAGYQRHVGGSSGSAGGAIKFRLVEGDTGEAGAINLYGRAWGLPEAISGSNSHWLRGYGDPPPQTVIAAGFRRRDLEAIFQSCELAGSIQMPFGIRNSAIGDRTDIFVCRRPRQPWDLFWRHFRWFG